MYIIKFKTAYPFGLNDRVNNISINSIKNDTCIYKNIFQNFVNPRTNRVRSKKRNNKYIDLHEFLGEIDNKGLKEKDLIKYVKSKILGINKRKAKKLLKIALNYKFKYNLIKDLILDLIKYKIGNDKLENIDNFESYLVINFSHKFIDLLNISQLLYDKELVKIFPVKFTYPKISFSYSKTLGSQVYNYSKFCKNIKADNVDEYP